MALAATSRRVRLLYASSDRDSVIFAGELSALSRRHPGRLAVVHHLDSESGMVVHTKVETFIGSGTEGEYYMCGPGGFMATVERALDRAGVAPQRVHAERFAAGPGPVCREAVDGPPVKVVFELGATTAEAAHRSGASLLQTARSAGLRAPSSCEIGSCATCMARVVEGSASMRQNTALTADEIEDGWVLTCQAVPTSSKLRVVFE